MEYWLVEAPPPSVMLALNLSLSNQLVSERTSTFTERTAPMSILSAASAWRTRSGAAAAAAPVADSAFRKSLRFMAMRAAPSPSGWPDALMRARLRVHPDPPPSSVCAALGGAKQGGLFGGPLRGRASWLREGFAPADTKQPDATHQNRSSRSMCAREPHLAR